MFSRREFIQKIFAGAASIPFVSFILSSCGKRISEHTVSGKIKGASAAKGHILRDKQLGAPSEIEKIDFVIVGGGIAGLSAARELKNANIKSFVLLELENESGGNSRFGRNEITPYPLGAHYLPLPGLRNKDLLNFLEEAEIITHYDNHGLPNFDEYYLCHDPQDRLYINGHWQDGLIPHFGLPDKDLNEITSFLKEVEILKTAKGNDGKYAFDIPLDFSSSDQKFVELDAISMYDYLLKHNYSSSYLHWYVNYACRDDYGTDIKNTSAWAGLHYFASRKGIASNADPSAVLTWPEGNGFLVEKLRKSLDDKIKTNRLVYSIESVEDVVHIDYFDLDSNSTKRIEANKCIVCTPQFVNKRILKNTSSREEKTYDLFSYSPWMVANLTVKPLSERNGRPLSWDNVFYEGKSLGFINDNHQNLSRVNGDKVFTFYYPLTDSNPMEERIAAQKRTHEEWVSLILKNFKKAYPEIESKLVNADVWLWGHGMIRPVPGFFQNESRKIFSRPIENKIFFAHSDLSGISIFEEAFHHGTRAAREALN